MGVNLKPEVNEFSIQPKAYFIKMNSSEINPPGTIAMKKGSVEEGCVTEGLHPILNFNFILKNIGDKDLIIGNPSSRLDIFEPTKHDPTKWITKKRFNEYYLKDKAGNIVASGYKRYYCIKDTTGRFNCNNQGISVGSQDTYSKNELCNFIVLNNFMDGIYTFEAVTNVAKIFEEDSYSDNTFSVNLNINVEKRIADPVR